MEKPYFSPQSTKIITQGETEEDLGPIPFTPRSDECNETGPSYENDGLEPEPESDGPLSTPKAPRTYTDLFNCCQRAFGNLARNVTATARFAMNYDLERLKQVLVFCEDFEKSREAAVFDTTDSVADTQLPPQLVRAQRKIRYSFFSFF